jgi:ATP-dependent Lon protease
MIALGGASDRCYLEGHSYTYEGSMYGQIVQILMKTKCMNPIIYFDELDKVSATPKGDEIIGILTHLIDTSQNDHFHDRYFSEVKFDLSKCLFIFSYNDESLVNPILRDRMYTIHVNGYDMKDKIIIATQYLIPSISKSIHLDGIFIPNETIQYIIEKYSSEKGVRNLKRCIETIYSKLNLYHLIKPTSKLFNEDAIIVKFPFTVTIEHVKLLIKSDKKDNSYYNLYL